MVVCHDIITIPPLPILGACVFALLDLPLPAPSGDAIFKVVELSFINSLPRKLVNHLFSLGDPLLICFHPAWHVVTAVMVSHPFELVAPIATEDIKPVFVQPSANDHTETYLKLDWEN